MYAKDGYCSLHTSVQLNTTTVWSEISSTLQMKMEPCKGKVYRCGSYTGTSEKDHWTLGLCLHRDVSVLNKVDVTLKNTRATSRRAAMRTPEGNDVRLFRPYWWWILQLLLQTDYSCCQRPPPGLWVEVFTLWLNRHSESLCGRMSTRR